jgi:integrase
MFGKKWAKHYDLDLPDLSGFLEAGNVKAPVKQYMVPLTHPDLVARTMAGIEELKAAPERRELRAAVVLMFGLAMRNSEAVAARWNWIVPDPLGSGQMVMFVCNRPEEGFSVKATGSTRWIPMAPGMVEELRALRQDDNPYVLPGTLTDRKTLMNRTLAQWMRGLGWDEAEFPKAGYELRKLRGSQWYTDQAIGPAQASRWLGHKSLVTTCQFYATLDRQATQRPM